NILPSITGEEFQLALDENLQNLAQNKAPITRDQMQKIVNNVIRRYKVASMKTQGFGSPFTSFEEGEEDYKYQTPYKIINPNFEFEGDDDEETVVAERPRNYKYIKSGFDDEETAVAERPRKYIRSGFDDEDDKDEVGEEIEAYFKPKSVKQDISRYKSFIDTMRNSPFAKKTPELKPLLSENVLKDDSLTRLMRLEGIQSILEEHRSQLNPIVIKRVESEIERAKEAEALEEQELLHIPAERFQTPRKKFESTRRGTNALKDLDDISHSNTSSANDEKEEQEQLEPSSAPVKNPTKSIKEMVRIQVVYDEVMAHLGIKKKKKGKNAGQYPQMNNKQYTIAAAQMKKNLNIPGSVSDYVKDYGLVFDKDGLAQRTTTITGRGLTKLPFGKYLIDHKKLK
ncbi:MAG: hypothetical protein P4L35_11610, partial [Ignavibacteriaceae bacterium]|nr:hypothetical protein [Ignavibacteriaceae bacterium]